MEAKDPEEIEEVVATDDSTNKSENTLKDLACCFLHRIAARTKVLPCNDLVSWVIESIISHTELYLRLMGECSGHLEQRISKECTICLNHTSDITKHFLEAFTKENTIELDSIRQWRHFLNKHKHESSGMYIVDSLASPYYYAGAMVCRLFGVHDSAKFSIEMAPLMDVAVNSFIMDWATIMSYKMANQILDYRENRFMTTRVIPVFYMSAYILDTICFNSEYPILVWKWTP